MEEQLSEQGPQHLAGRGRLRLQEPQGGRIHALTAAGKTIAWSTWVKQQLQVASWLTGGFVFPIQTRQEQKSSDGHSWGCCAWGPHWLLMKAHRPPTCTSHSLGHLCFIWTETNVNASPGPQVALSFAMPDYRSCKYLVILILRLNQPNTILIQSKFNRESQTGVTCVPSEIARAVEEW